MQFLALLIDYFLGDPPNAWHPVAWMGTGIAKMRQAALKKTSRQAFLSGGVIALSGVGMSAGVGWILAQWIRFLPKPLAWLVEAGLLKIMLAVGSLGRAAKEVQSALDDGDLPEARRLTSWHLVSRETATLSESQVAAATIESVTENTSDSIVAPLFFYTLFGLPGAFAYRFANTADAMLGYHDAEREWLGKIPARFDDLLNFIPARLTAFCFVFVSWLLGWDARRTFSIWRRDCHKTESPNAGHPMSAGAGALGVELEKIGFYKLGAGEPTPNIHDIGRSVRLMSATASLVAIFFALFAWLKKTASTVFCGFVHG